MRVSAVIWGYLCLIGAGALKGPSEVTVPYGEELSVKCDYSDGFRSYVKYWCRGAYWNTCNIIVKSTDEKSKHRYFIEDNPPSANFIVTRRQMRLEDSDTYHCGIERQGLDEMHSVRVTVLPGVCKKTPLWASIVDFPPGFETIEENKVVEVSCKKQYDNRTFHLTCVKESEVFQFYPRPEPPPCTRKCGRLMDPGQNIVMYPEKEYYDQDEEVMITCPAGYLPNYSKIRCIRSNGTNIWNVSEIFCIYSPRKCGRLMDSGQNISMYPVKEYYDQDEEVTLTCPAGYSPNYSKIRCIRSNGTNMWNVTKVFCIYSPSVIPFISNHSVSWKNIGVSCCLGVIPPMVVKLITILVILSVKFSVFVKRRFSSVEESPHNRQPDVEIMKSSRPARSNLYHKVTEDQKVTTDTEDDPELIYNNMEVTEDQKVTTDTEDDPELIYNNMEVIEDQKVTTDTEDDPELIYNNMEVTKDQKLTTGTEDNPELIYVNMEVTPV